MTREKQLDAIIGAFLIVVIGALVVAVFIQ